MAVIIRSPTLQQPNTDLKINQSLLNLKLGGDYACLLVVYGTRAIADTQGNNKWHIFSFKKYWIL